MKKKIIFVTKALWVGGIETALVNLLKHFDYVKYDVTLLVLHAELDMLKRIPEECKVLIIDRDDKYSFDKIYQYKKLYHMTEETDNPSLLHRMMMWIIPIIKWIENKLYIRYIRDLMKNEYFDTAVIYSDVVAEATIRAIKADKFLMFYHHGAMRHVYHDRIAYQKCEKIIAVSEKQADELKNFVPEYANKIMTIHNFTDIEGVEEKSKLSCEDIFEKTKFNIVSVGRVAYEKGMDIAVKVCAELVKRGFNNIRWWIVGGGPAEQEVRDVIAELHMEEHVKMVGMKGNPYPYIKQADLYVQPSRFESFGLTIMEALILEKRVIATNTFGAREIIEKYQKGMLCDIDVDVLANQIEKIIRMQVTPDEFLKSSITEEIEEANKSLMIELERLL